MDSDHSHSINVAICLHLTPGDPTRSLIVGSKDEFFFSGPDSKMLFHVVWSGFSLAVCFDPCPRSGPASPEGSVVIWCLVRTARLGKGKSYSAYQIRFPFRVNEIRLTAIHAPGGRGLPIILCYFPGSDFLGIVSWFFFLGNSNATLSQIVVYPDLSQTPSSTTPRH